MGNLPGWVLREPVEVTGLYQSPDDVVQILLVQRTGPSKDCVVVTFRGGDGIELNGQPFVESVENQFWDLCSLADDANGRANADGMLKVGQMVLSFPFQD